MLNDDNNGCAAPASKNAVQWRALDRTIAEVRSKFSDLSAETIESLIDEAITAVRSTSKKGE
jgi:phage I-like protein